MSWIPPPPTPSFFSLISWISIPFLLFLDYEADNEPKALALFDDSEEDGKGNWYRLYFAS